MNPSAETSGKPADIPQDVWDVAFHEMDCHCPEAMMGDDSLQISVHRAIARAIMVERARCAHIAFCAYDRKTEICSRIVRKIRSGVER